MPLSETFTEDLVSNAILGVAMVLVMAARDLCKRISHSDCAVDSEGVRFKLPTWRENEEEVDTNTA